MLIDAFTFFNELDLLDIRLAYLNDIVDKFVIVEAGKTQSLLDKPFYYEMHEARYHKYKDKIVHVKVEDYPDTGGWAMENHQRNCIVRGLAGARGDDLIMISDLDEIPNKQVLFKEMLMASINLTTSSFNHMFCAYYLNLACPNKRWFGTVLTNVTDAIRHSPQGLRRNKDNMPHIEGGWHFSWLGGWDKVKTKFKSCIEPFDKRLDYDNLEKRFAQVAKDGGFFLHSDNPLDVSVPLTKVPMESLPDVVQAHPELYPHLLLS